MKIENEVIIDLRARYYHYYNDKIQLNLDKMNDLCNILSDSHDKCKSYDDFKTETFNKRFGTEEYYSFLENTFSKKEYNIYEDIDLHSIYYYGINSTEKLKEKWSFLLKVT